MKRILLALLLTVALASTALAKPQDLSWTWPTTDCDGAPLSQADWVSGEIIYDVSPMPMPSDAGGPCTGTPDPDGPVSSTSVATTSATTITLNLQPGVTYYARIRTCYNTPTNCSNWSAEVSFVVPYGKPGAPIWLN